MTSDHDRLVELFEACAPRLHAYARRHAAPQDAEDLVASAFEVALRRLDEVPAERHLAFAWLIGTVRRLAANQRRRLATRERHWRDAVREGWHTTASPEDAVAEREESVAALAALSPADRELVLLVAWDGLTPEQAAEVLGVSRGTLAVRLHRARRRLGAPHATLAVHPGGTR